MWQKKLSVSDSVISIWFEVQRTWSHLESIFIGSEDIRNQLPEDSKRFDGIDVDFKVRFFCENEFINHFLFQGERRGGNEKQGTRVARFGFKKIPAQYSAFVCFTISDDLLH